MVKNLSNTIVGTVLAEEMFRASKTPLGDKERTQNLFHIWAAIEEYEIDNLAQIAYIFATVRHECSFLCIKEIRAKQGTAVWEMQEKYWSSGYYGRGFCQLTWRRNYEKFQRLFNVNLVEEPDLALDPELSARILVLGMRDGLFSGTKLSDHINDRRVNFTTARKIVNGNFQADKVKEVAEKIYACLY